MRKGACGARARLASGVARYDATRATASQPPGSTSRIDVWPCAGQSQYLGNPSVTPRGNTTYAGEYMREGACGARARLASGVAHYDATRATV